MKIMESERKIEDYEISSPAKGDDLKPSNGVAVISKEACEQAKENVNPNKDNGEVKATRRADEPSELSFEICKSRFVVVSRSMISSIFLLLCV